MGTPKNTPEETRLIALGAEAISDADLPLISASHRESLFFAAEKPRGMWRIFLGILPLIKDTILKAKLLHEPVSAPIDSLLQSPYENENPLGFIFARNPCRDMKSAPAIVEKAVKSGKTPEFDWNEVHIDTIRETLDLVHVTCLVCGVTGAGKIDSTAVVKRILDQHRHVIASDYSKNKKLSMTLAERFACTGGPISGHLARNRLLALRLLDEEEKVRRQDRKTDIFARIPGDWFSASVGKRGESKPTFQTQLRSNPERFRKFLFFTEPENTRSSTKVGKITEKLLRNSDKIQSLSRIASPGQPCLPEIRNLVRLACASLEQPGPAAIAFLVSAGVPPWNIQPYNIDVGSSSAVVRRPVLLWQDSIVVDETIHEVPTTTFVSFTSASIGAAVKQHLAAHLDLESESNAWLETHSHGITVSKLCSTLRHNLPIWSAMPAIYYALGIDGLSRNHPGWMHYIHYDPRDWLPAISNFLRAEFDPNFSCDASNLETTGSALCPTSESLSVLFDTASHLARNPTFTDIDTAIADSNIVAAAARLAENLLTFTRNRDDFEPLALHARSRDATHDVTRVLREKQFLRTIVYTRSLRLLLLRLNGALRLYLAMLRDCGLEGSERVTRSAYWFLELNKGLLAELPFSHRTVSDCLVAHPKTTAIQYMHRRVMRNYSNTVLRVDGVLPEDVILAIHNHYPSRARSPHSPDSLRARLIAVEREIAARHLVKRVNMEWAVS